MDGETVRELFFQFGRVDVRRMFGGAGLYADGLMFGLVADGVIYLKTDPANAGYFEREGCAPFSYWTKNGRRALMSYWRLPDRLYDEPDELAAWATRALNCAAAGKTKKTAKARARPPSPRRTR